MKNIPAFPYGAVYFRKSNPPREDWEKDYNTAREDGFNIFRHWLLWSAVEVAQGKFDWSEYDRQLDLAAQNGMKTIIAEMVTSAPEWAHRRYAHARFVNREGSPIHSSLSASCAAGGFPGLCLDNEDAKALAGNFLKELASRYKDHPGLGGYDIWNECNYSPDLCYCEGTRNKFRQWLKKKYGDLKTLGEVWRRYSYEDWCDVNPPFKIEPYPECIDWVEFRKENAYDLMKWRADLIRSIDPEHPITAHGIASSIISMAQGGADDWMAASNVDSYGYTWIIARKGGEPWRLWHAADLVRAASRGKPFWHTEFQGGPLWMQPQVINRRRDDGRILEPEDIRLWHMVSFAGGARGLFYLRWRPLLDGPLFSSFGPYGLDGSRTPRSEMASRLAKWATDEKQEKLWAAKPVKGDIGIVIAPESQEFNYVQQGSTDFYQKDLWGAYQGFFDNNIQADWVRIDHIDEYDLLYLPYPVMLTAKSAEKIKQWVKNGGKLISEGCPGYFGDMGRVCTVQPGLGFDEMFGVKETYSEFTPDILDDVTFSAAGINGVYGGIFLQEYETAAGKILGEYENGAAAVVENSYGLGKTLVIGTFPGMGYWNHHSNSSRSFFSSLLEWAGKTPNVECRDAGVTVRIHMNDNEAYLWIINHNRENVEVALSIAEKLGSFKLKDIKWGGPCVKVEGNTVTCGMNARDAAVLELDNG